MDERKRMLYLLYRAEPLQDSLDSATAPSDDRLREVNTSMNSNREGSANSEAGGGGPKRVDGQQSVVNDQRPDWQQTADSLESADSMDGQPSTVRHISTPRTSPTPAPAPDPICPDCIDIGLEKCECDPCYLGSGLCLCREMREDLIEILWQLELALQTEHWAKGDAQKQLTSYVAEVHHKLTTRKSEPVKKWYNERTFRSWVEYLGPWAIDEDGKSLAWAPLTAATWERLREWNGSCL